MYYATGVFSSVDAADWIKNNEDQPEWRNVEHAVLCYGWGEENGEKFWRCLNSWGLNWGDQGHFKIRRGTDESSIESYAEWIDPIVVDKTKKK